MKTSILLSLSALLLMVVVAACASATQEPRVVLTVMAARIEGKLIEENGCVKTPRSNSDGVTLVWQKDIHRIERRGDTFLFSNLYGDEAQPVTWRLGDIVVGGGGFTGAQVADDHAGAGFSERCPGPYFLVGAMQ